MTIPAERPLMETGGIIRTGIIDCDVHPGPRTNAEIKEHMPLPFRDRWNGGGRGFFGNPVHGARLDAVHPAEGGRGPTLISFASSSSMSSVSPMRFFCHERFATCTRTLTWARRLLPPSMTGLPQHG